MSRKFSTNPADDTDPVCGEPACIEHGHGTLGCPQARDDEEDDDAA